MSSHKELSRESWVVAAGRDRSVGSPLNVPVIPASNFVLGGEREYARDEGTTSWAAFEEIVGGLEGGRAVSFSSGMAAVAAVFDLLPHAAKIALPKDCYQGVAGLAEAGRARAKWEIERIAVDDTEAWLGAAAEADLIWLESPSNPLLVVADLRAVCAAKRRRGSILAVDNTFATPINQRPLELGADFSMQSVTKFLGGHSDLLSGVVTTNNDDLWSQLSERRTLAGATPGSLETFLAVRGVRTLALRLERAQASAGVLAERLYAHPKVDVTRYPGLPSYPNHEVAKAQLGGFGTVISFDVAGGARQADAVCKGVELIEHATSLGAVESTMERRAAIPGQEHLPESLLRLSVGIEDVEDLWADLEQALSSL